jgi:hypothetical protein
MFISRLIKILFAYCLALVIQSSAAQSNPKKEGPPLTRILFLFDASNSMYGQWQSGVKIDIAKKLLGQLIRRTVTIQNLKFHSAKKTPVPSKNG